MLYSMMHSTHLQLYYIEHMVKDHMVKDSKKTPATTTLYD